MKHTALTSIRFLLLPPVLALVMMLLATVEANAQSSPAADFFTQSYSSYIEWVDGLGMTLVSSVIRCAFALVFCTILCSLTLRHAATGLHRGSIVALQWACCLLALLISLEIPLYRVHYSATAKAWVFAFALMAMVALPWRLAWTLTPKNGHARRLAKLIYGLVLIVFVVGWLNSP